MSLQFVGNQIANAAITPAKLDLASAGITYDFVNVGLKYKTNPALITEDGEVASKAYVDSVAQGLYWKDAVTAATTANLNATYNNGSSGIGATLTNAGTNAAFNIDNAASYIGGSFSVGERVLIKNQTDQKQNGIYEVTTVGSGAAAWVLTRAADQDAPIEFLSAAVFVSAGDTNANIGFVCTSNVDTVGSDNVTFTSFTGTSAIVAGAGISKTSNTLAVELTALSGLTFSAAGDAGTLEVILKPNDGLQKTDGRIAVDYDNTTIGIVSNKLAVKDGGIELVQLGTSFSYDEFNTAGATIFQLATANASATHRTGANIKVYRNGQRLRVGAMNSLAAGQYAVFQDGAATKVAINGALVAGEIVQADYLK